MTPEDAVFHGCALLVLGALGVLYALRAGRGPLARCLDRRIEAAVCIPAGGVG